MDRGAFSHTSSQSALVKPAKPCTQPGAFFQFTDHCIANIQTMHIFCELGWACSGWIHRTWWSCHAANTKI